MKPQSTEGFRAAGILCTSDNTRVQTHTKSERSRNLWTLVTTCRVGPSIVTNVPLWWGRPVGGFPCVWTGGLWERLYFLPNLAVKLKLL